MERKRVECKMNEIHVMVKPVSNVVGSASVDIESPKGFWGKVVSCYNCGGLLFYQVMTKVDGTRFATDTNFFCAVCGANCGGIYNDPNNEMEFKPYGEGDEKDDTTNDG